MADAEGGKPQVILMATGSEVYLCIDAYENLKAEGVRARVVSMPSWELFEHQDRSYREAGVAARSYGSRGRRTGLFHGVGPICRSGRTDYRHAHVRSIGADKRLAEEVRLHFRCYRAGSPRTAWGETELTIPLGS